MGPSASGLIRSEIDQKLFFAETISYQITPVTGHIQLEKAIRKAEQTEKVSLTADQVHHFHQLREQNRLDGEMVLSKQRAQNQNDSDRLAPADPPQKYERGEAYHHRR